MQNGITDSKSCTHRWQQDPIVNVTNVSLKLLWVVERQRRQFTDAKVSVTVLEDLAAGKAMDGINNLLNQMPFSERLCFDVMGNRENNSASRQDLTCK